MPRSRSRRRSGSPREERSPRSTGATATASRATSWSAARGSSTRRAGSTRPATWSSEAGEVAEIAPAGERRGSGAPRSSTRDGLHLFPAFFDPHVHLRTPGREDEEDLETGSRAAAAGGYCGIAAMANTEPPVDTPAGVRGAARAGVARGVGAHRLHGLRDAGDAGRGADRHARAARGGSGRVLR